MKTGRILRLWAAAAALAWLLVFGLGKEGGSVAPLVRPAERWAPPTLPERADLREAAAVVAASPLWGEKPKAGQAAAPEQPMWVIAGTYNVGHEWRAVVSFKPDQPELQVKVGDALPNGERIVEIRAERVAVGTKKGRHWLPVGNAKDGLGAILSPPGGQAAGKPGTPAGKGK